MLFRTGNLNPLRMAKRTQQHGEPFTENRTTCSIGLTARRLWGYGGGVVVQEPTFGNAPESVARSSYSPLDKWRESVGLDATKLKIIAVVLMVLDHIHQMWAHVGAPMWLTMLGRPVFPIFLFAMAESFHYTRNRKRFLTRLLLASWAMTIGSTVISTMFPSDDIVLMNNAFSTFFVAGLYMLFYDIIRDGVRQHSVKRVIGGALLFLVPIVTAIPMFLIGTISADPYFPAALLQVLLYLSLLIPNILAVEGGFTFVLLGLLFYILRPRRWAQVALLAAFSLLVLLSGDTIQALMVFAAIPILLYNGKPGKGMKDFFYIFYPAHIWILYLISTLMTKFGIQA